jgi:amidase
MIQGMDEIDATGLAELVRARKVSPRELCEAAIARIERVNPKLNAVVTPMFERALERAAGELPDGPFRGVPFLMKDLGASYGGVRMTAGSRFLAEYVPDFSSELTVRLERAGLVVLGKTNTPEFGILPTTEPHFLGRCKNPWTGEHTTGGSSGGSAAAVAAGMVPMAHANDGGGSIRIPASCCGLFGLKPTRARNPMGPRIGDVMNGLVAEHAVTRSVRDSARLLDATHGHAPGDPYWAPPPVRPYAAELVEGGPRLRVALCLTTPYGTPLHPDAIAATRDAAKLCEELGHHVEEAAPNLDGPMLLQTFMAVWTSGVAMSIAGYAHLLGREPKDEELEPLTRVYRMMGKAVPAPDYLLAIAYLQQMSREVAAFMSKHDVWLTPTLGEPPLRLGELDTPDGDPSALSIRLAHFVPFTPIANITGQPAMSVPLFWNEAGLPVGAHFFGRFGDEGTLFRLAAELERARPWAQRRPPIHA